MVRSGKGHAQLENTDSRRRKPNALEPALSPVCVPRKLPLSITVTPSKKGGDKMSSPLQLAMVRLVVYTLRNELLAKWQREQVLSRAHYCCEMASEAHLQGYEETITTCERNLPVPTDMVARVRSAKTTKARYNAEQAIRNYPENWPQ